MTDEMEDGATARPKSRVRQDFDEAWSIYSDCIGDTHSPRDNVDVVATIFLGVCQARIAESMARIAAALEEANRHDD